MLGSFNKPAIAALSVTLGLSATAAFAQTAAESGSLALEEIVITAQRTESSLQKTPIAVTALSAQDLEQKSVKTLVDVANFTPNLSIGGRAGSGSAQGSIAIRGIGFAAPDSASAVGIYVDEVYYPSTFGTLLGVFDLQRIEVLRGPQGTLFGRNTLAGAIQYVSVKPSTDKVSGFVEGSGGTKESYSIGGALNLPLGDTLAMRISARKSQTGGYIHDNLNNIDRGRDITSQGRVQLRWTPTDKLSVDLKLEGVKSENNGRPATVGAFNPGAPIYLSATGKLPPGPGPQNLPLAEQEPNKALPAVDGPNTYTTAGFNAPDFFSSRFNTISGTIAYAFTDNLTLKSISAYDYTNNHAATDFDGTPLAIIKVDRGTEVIDLFTQELQLSGINFDERLHWTVGGFYYNAKQHTAGSYNTTGFSAVVTDATSEIKTVSKAGYAQATYNITTAISGTLGIRYSKEDIDASFPNGVVPPPTPIIPSRSFKDTSPYYGLNWQMNNDTLFYVKASKGFRAGGVHLSQYYRTVPSNPNYAPGALYFAPETAWNYELGGRFTLINGRLKLNPTIFQTDWTNVQFSNIDRGLSPGVIAGTRNAGDARLRGVELESQFAATERLELSLAYSYLQSEYTRLDPTLTVLSGTTTRVVLNITDPLQRAPKNKYSVGARYKQPFASGADLVANVDYAYTAEQRSTVDGDQAITMNSFGLLGARVAFHPANSNFEFALYGTNLLDKYYLLDGISFRSATGPTALTVGRPREGGVSVKYKF